MRTFLSVLSVLFILLVGSCTSNNQKKGTNPDNLKIASCDSLEYYYKQYLERKDQVIEKRYGAQLVRIDTSIGNSYIEAYLREGGKDKTEGVVLDITTIAFLYKYLEANPSHRIGLGLARYSKKYWTIGRSVNDPEFDTRLSANDVGRLAIVIGAYNEMNRFIPLTDGSGGFFYDDWNQEWP